MKNKLQLHAVPNDKIKAPEEVGRYVRALSKYEGRFSTTWYYSRYMDSEDIYNPHHLYLTSDDSIGEGDWVMNMYNNVHSIFQITQVFTDGYEGKKLGKEGALYVLQQTLVKIIATTNPDLWGDGIKVTQPWGEVKTCQYTVAKIPQSLIEYFVEEQGNVKEVMVEYYTEQVSRSIIGYTPAKEATSIGNYKINPKLNQSGEIIWFPANNAIVDVFVNGKHVRFENLNSEQVDALITLNSAYQCSSTRKTKQYGK